MKTILFIIVVILFLLNVAAHVWRYLHDRDELTEITTKTDLAIQCHKKEVFLKTLYLTEKSHNALGFIIDRFGEYFRLSQFETCRLIFQDIQLSKLKHLGPDIVVALLAVSYQYKDQIFGRGPFFERAINFLQMTGMSASDVRVIAQNYK